MSNLDISEFLANFAVKNSMKSKHMQFEFVDMEEFTGRMAHIYTVQLKGDESTLLEQFFSDNQQYESELNQIVQKLHVMGNDIGCRREYFTHEEGRPGDGVAVLKACQLRLYCLYFDRTAVFFGSGGYKPPQAHAYQEVPKLNERATQMKEIAAKINRAIIERDIEINEDGSLTINYWEL